ncbi:hypothetical protein ASE00_12900 [Sphingomonas sp. Root710]|nr:hypothetical protein ASE00_12900 [Sphingomonas sp. Root710]
MVAVSGGRETAGLLDHAERLATALGIGWEALHVETPEQEHDPDRVRGVAEALSRAAALGASIATIAAATVGDGLSAHLRSSRADHLVIGAARSDGSWRRSSDKLAATVSRDIADIALHIYPTAGAKPARRSLAAPSPALTVCPRHVALASLAVAATLLIAEGLQLWMSSRSLDLLFLFPVIAMSARYGFIPGLTAAFLSVLCYNFFLLRPAFSFDPAAPQNVVMGVVLAVVSVYTGVMTHRLRSRLVLSDRSAQENASLAAFAQRLTGDASWEATAATVCEHVHRLLNVHTVLLREVGGELEVAAAAPAFEEIGPVDRAALDWAWQHGTATGAGTATLASANWQFQPLKTSLGILAVLGLARADGRDPTPPHQQLMLSTILAQAALAHERLRLEDDMKASRPPADEQRD